MKQYQTFDNENVYTFGNVSDKNERSVNNCIKLEKMKYYNSSLILS